MGLLDSVKNFGNRVLEGAKGVEKSVEKSVTETVSHTVETAKDGYESVKKAAVELASNPSVIPSKATQLASQVAHTWYDDLNHAADRFGGAMSTAGGLLEKGGKALGPYVPFANEAVAIGHAAQTVGKGIADAPETAVSTATSLIHTAQDLEKKGEDFVHRAEGVVGQGIDAAKKGLEVVGQGVEGLKNAVTGFVSEIARATDYRHNIDELGPNDKYKLAVGGNGSVEGVKLYGKGSVEVARNAQGKYVVSVDGELGGGIYGEVGGKLGAKLNAEASATLGVGGKMEMTFNSAEEAKKATEIVLKQAAASAVSSQADRLLPGASLVTNKALGPSADELKFLADHTSALELRGNVAAEVAGCVGLKDVAGLFGGAKVKDEVAVRIELKDENGKPKQPELVVKQTVSGEATLGAGLRVSDGAKEATGASATYAGGKGEAKVEVEQRWTLPNASGADLLGNPAKTIRDAASSMVKSEKDKITLGLDLSGQAFGNGGGVAVEASYSGNFSQLGRSTIDQLRRGDVAGALKTLDGNQMSVKLEPYKTIGVSYAPSVSVMGFGVGAEFEATRKDVADEPYRYEKTGKPSEIANDLNARLAPYLPYVRTGLPPNFRG